MAAGSVEQALVFNCSGHALVGVLCAPTGPVGAEVGVLVVVGGPQYRAGSHRQFVLLARTLAAAGFPVLRFDHRGMGDSAGALRDFEGVSDDIAAAIAAMHVHLPSMRRVVLWGLCDGASAALLYLQQTKDPRVAGLCLLNPWVRSAASLAQTQVKHYYRQRLQERAFWAKLLRGRVALAALRDLWANLRTAWGGSGGGSRDGSGSGSGSGSGGGSGGGSRKGSRGGSGGDSGRGAGQGAAREMPFQLRMAQGWSAFGGAILLLLSERDATAQEFGEVVAGDPVWLAAIAKRAPHRVRLAGADHTCSQPAAQSAAEQATLQWLRANFAAV